MFLNDIYYFLLSTIYVGNYKFHAWSFIVYGLFMFFVLLKLIRYIHPIYSLMIAFTLSMIGNDVYETLWQYIMWETGINSYFIQYIVVDAGMIIMILAINREFKFFKFNKMFVILLLIEYLSFGVLAYTGHYVAMRIWFTSNFTSPDPHNWIWMINKALSVWMLYPLVKTKEKKTVV
jgi:hypothetical protein